jgi:signal transduction histidine kinase
MERAPGDIPSLPPSPPASLNVLSHELRTPLTSIKGYTELMLEGAVGELSEEQREFLLVVGRNVDRLTETINTLLTQVAIPAETE